MVKFQRQSRVFLSKIVSNVYFILIKKLIYIRPRSVRPPSAAMHVFTFECRCIVRCIVTCIVRCTIRDIDHTYHDSLIKINCSLLTCVTCFNKCASVLLLRTAVRDYEILKMEIGYRKTHISILILLMS